MNKILDRARIVRNGLERQVGSSGRAGRETASDEVNPEADYALW